MPIVDEDVEAYAAEHCSEVSDLYERLREETYAATTLPQMQVGRIEGRLLKLLVQLSGARRAVEIGTFTGYSSLSIAEGLPDDGTLICLDVSEEWTAIARRYWAEAPWGDKIELRLGPAIESLEAIDGPIDFVFIDADKEGYIGYWEALLPKMAPGGLLVIDNVLWSGSVLAPETESAKAIVAFNAHAAADDRVEQVLLTVRDGITVARVR
ncbi:MAG: methyltransferase [Proteobacteria bacterium]|nr:methyltransferase [Pseudomonadota bacterium]